MIRRMKLSFAAAALSLALPCAAQALTVYSEDFNDGIANNAVLFGNATVTSNLLQLTTNAGSQQGSMVINDLNPGSAINSFNASFLFQAGPGTATPADGISFSFGNLPNASFGEEGPAGTNLTIAFDTFDNGGAEAPAIDLKVNGVVLSHNTTNPYTNGALVPVSVLFNDKGQLSLTFNGNPIFTNVNTGYVPQIGDRFGFGGRTGGLNEVNRIDNVVIATNVLPEPATLTLLGFAGLAALRRQRRTA